MSIDARTRQILWGKAGATCAYPKCRRSLVRDATLEDREVLVGEIAHIVSQGERGPRSGAEIPGENIDGYDNLILLCHEHHELVDQQEHTYPVERLLHFKQDHEKWVKARLSRDLEYEGLSRPTNTVVETVYATLMPVLQLPDYVYSGVCPIPEKEVKASINWPSDKRILVPFIVRDGLLYAFNDMRDRESPFATIVEPGTVERHDVCDWWEQPDEFRWYIELLNRTVNKITGHLGLKLDKEHHRYYFEPNEPGVEKRVTYQSVGGVQSDRAVAWNPRFKHSGDAKRYWEHLAVGLHFHRLGPYLWALAIRPERRFTTDGYTALDGTSTGKKNTKRKSRMYNFDVLKEVQFWRDFLAQGTPRITCLFGGQSLVIDNTLMSTSITWPKIEGDQAKHIAARYEDDLFSIADLAETGYFNDSVDDTDELDTDEGDQIED